MRDPAIEALILSGVGPRWLWQATDLGIGKSLADPAGTSALKGRYSNRCATLVEKGSGRSVSP